MRSVLALIRAAFLSATSYRLAMLMSIAGLLATVVPLYFVSGALQPVVAESIRTEGGEYFGFLVVGVAATYLMIAALSAIPGALAGSIGSGTFEALLVTRTSLPALLVGMSGYPMLWNLTRATILVIGADLVGVDVRWQALPAVVFIGALLVIAYGAIGLVAAALILVFRTAGPLVTAVMAGSSLLGGVYYSTTVIPAWLQSLSAVVPLTYGLRATRMLLLGGAPWDAVGPDVGMLALMAGTGLAIGSAVFLAALQHARRAGTLSQY